MCHSRSLASKIKAQRLFPSDKFMDVIYGLRQVNLLRGVCDYDGVKRVVCRYRWECFGCFIEEGAFWGVLFNSYSFTIRWFLSVLEDHDCESTLFWLVFGLEAKTEV